LETAKKQKSFGSFLQKRTASLKTRNQSARVDAAAGRRGKNRLIADAL
jgi:hypothetical protein